MKVNLNELKEITMMLITKLIEQQNEIELNNDFYWDISNDEKYSPYTEPENLSLGQLSDDLTTISRLKENCEDVIPYDLKRVAELLRAIVHENPVIY